MSGCVASGFRDVAHLQAERRLHEAGLFEEAGEEVFAGRGVVDFADQQSGAAGLAADGDLGERAGKFAGEAGAVGLVLRQDDADGGLRRRRKAVSCPLMRTTLAPAARAMP